MNRKAMGFVSTVSLILLLFLVVVGGLVYLASNGINFVQPITIYPMQEIHIETAWNYTIWTQTLEYLERNPNLYVMLLVQHWPNNQTNNLVMERYAILRDKGYNLGLHVHIAVEPEIHSVSYDNQYSVIRYGKYVLDNLDIPTTRFTPGYWSWNANTIKALKQIGYTHIHLWTDKIRPINGLEVVKIENYTHDWELI